jgi:hypothetical protein
MGSIIHATDKPKTNNETWVSYLLFIANTAPPILERLQIDLRYWLYMAQHFESRLKGLVGTAYKAKAFAASLGYQRTPNLAACRELPS